jgi:hypothetical protein
MGNVDDDKLMHMKKLFNWLFGGTPQHVRISETGRRIIENPALARKVSDAIITNGETLQGGGFIEVEGIKIRRVCALKLTQDERPCN